MNYKSNHFYQLSGENNKYKDKGFEIFGVSLDQSREKWLKAIRQLLIEQGVFTHKLASPFDATKHRFNDGRADPAGRIWISTLVDARTPATAALYCIESGVSHLEIPDLIVGNGLAFSPDQRWLYVANSDPAAAQWWRFAVQADGSLATGELFADATDAVSSQPGLPDGLKVLPSGQILATGPGGIWVFSASGQQLGLLQLPVAAANLALSEDRQYLYITASSYLLRMALKPLNGFRIMAFAQIVH